MPASSPYRMAKVIEQIAECVKDSDELEWPGLRKDRRPTKREGQRFFLGSCIDYMQNADVAWAKVDDLLINIVPHRYRDDVFSWICRRHTKAEWARKHHKYNLHRFPSAHTRLYGIAKSIVNEYDGDPRNVWERTPARKLLDVLTHDVKVGSAIGHMMVGALRDNGLISKRRSDFKPDRHVCRLMKAIGLSQSDNPKDVIAAGRRWFKDPWAVDKAFYVMGREGVKNRLDVERYYRRAVLGKVKAIRVGS